MNLLILFILLIKLAMFSLLIQLLAFIFDCIDCVDCVHCVEHVALLVKMNSTCMLVYIDMLLATVKDATVACSLLVIFYMFAIKRVFAAPSG